MVRLLKQLHNSEKGQALLIVLGVLAIGGLTVAVSLNYATTSLRGGRILLENTKGIYAAGAGIEYVSWSLANGVTPSTELTENVSQMAVSMLTEDKGTITLYLGELIEPGQHSDYLDVDGNIVLEAGDTYKFTITVTWQAESGEPPIKLLEVGARIPTAYSYQVGSAASFADNLSTDEPEETSDGSGGLMLNWELDSPYPSVTEGDPVQTQTFYITGTGSQEGDYSWVVANRNDIGAVGEITGTKYEITATAVRPEDGRIMARIVADVIIGGGTTQILSWQILN